MVPRMIMILFMLSLLLFGSSGVCELANSSSPSPEEGQEASGPAGKIGFVTLRKISDESLKKKAFDEEVKKLLEEKRPERDAIKKEIEDLERAIALSGPEQAKREQEKIQQKKLELLRFDGALRQEIEKKQAIFEKEILEEISEAVKEVAEEKGYTWVLMDEVLLHRDDSADLTFQTLVRMNEKYIKSRPPGRAPPAGEAEVETPGPMEGPGKEKTSSSATPLPVSAENALIEEVTKSGVRNRTTIKEIQPRKGAESGSITMKGEGGRIRFVSQYSKDMTPGAGGIISPPVGNQSVWRFVGEVSLSGYTFTGLDEGRPLSFILLEEVGLVHLYGRGSVTSPNGHSVAIGEEKPSPGSRTEAKEE